MEDNKKKRLEAKGYTIGSAEDFLGLSRGETEYIELKLALSQTLAKQRKQKNMTQIQLAKLLKSSQSRVAKMEIPLCGICKMPNEWSVLCWKSPEVHRWPVTPGFHMGSTSPWHTLYLKTP